MPAGAGRRQAGSSAAPHPLSLRRSRRGGSPMVSSLAFLLPLLIGATDGRSTSNASLDPRGSGESYDVRVQFSPERWDDSATNRPIRLGVRHGYLQGRYLRGNATAASEYINHIGVPRLARWMEASSVVRGKSICLACPVALDLEAHRVVDWVSYHSLLGVDCFILFLDAQVQNLTESNVHYAWRMLARAPNVQLFEQPHGMLGGTIYTVKLSELISKMTPGTQRPEFFVYIDSDEFLLVDEDEDEAASERGHGRERRAKVTATALPSEHTNRADIVRLAGERRALPPQRAPTDGLLLRRLRAAAGDQLGVVLFAFKYGTSFVVKGPSMRELPEFAYLTRRYGDPDRDRVVPVTQENAGVLTSFFGKVALRVASGAFLLSMHRWRYEGRGTNDNLGLGEARRPVMRLSNGTDFTCSEGPADPKGSPADLLSCPSPGVTTRQPIGINHYTSGSLEHCRAKAERARYHSGRVRQSLDCDQQFEKYRQIGRNWWYFNNIEDPVLAQYAVATRAPAHWAMVFSCGPQQHAARMGDEGGALQQKRLRQSLRRNDSTMMPECPSSRVQPPA